MPAASVKRCFELVESTGVTMSFMVNQFRGWGQSPVRISGQSQESRSKKCMGRCSNIWMGQGRAEWAEWRKRGKECRKRGQVGQGMGSIGQLARISVVRRNNGAHNLLEIRTMGIERA